MSLLIVAALLIGPNIEPPAPNIRLTIHVGSDRASAIIRSEWVNEHPAFLARRLRIAQMCRVELVEDRMGRPT